MMISPSTMARICQLGALSPTGRCKTMDAAADGYGRSEGCVVFVLASSALDDEWNSRGDEDEEGDVVGSGGLRRRRDRALDQTFVYVVGTSMNQDGRSSSLTTPNGASQQSLLRTAAFQAEVDSLQSVMLHGTATPLGDPIEVAAITAVYAGARYQELQRSYDDEHLHEERDHPSAAAVSAPTHLSAPKSTVGHAEGAAGVHSLLAAVSALQLRRSAPVAHMRQISEHVVSAAGGASFVIPVQSSSTAPLTSPSGAGVSTEIAGTHSGCSAFGMSGVNAHAVVRATTSSGGGGGGGLGGFAITDVSRCRWSAVSAAVVWPSPPLDAILSPTRHGQVLGAPPHRFFYAFSLSDSAYAADLLDHHVRGRALLPAAAGLSMMVAAARTLLGSRDDDGVSLCDVTFSRPTFIDSVDRAAVVPDSADGNNRAATEAAAAAAKRARPATRYVCCTVGLDGIAAITDDVFAAYSRDFVPTNQFAPGRSASGGVVPAAAAMQCRVDRASPAARSPPLALGSARCGDGNVSSSAAAAVCKALMDYRSSSSSWNTSSRVSCGPGVQAGSTGDVVIARVTSGGESSTDAVGRHPSDVHLCPRLMDAAMHSGAAAASSPHVNGRGMNPSGGGGGENRENPIPLAIPCELRHFFARGVPVPREVVASVRTRRGRDGEASSVTDHVITDPVGNQPPCVVMRGLMTKAVSKSSVVTNLAELTAAPATTTSRGRRLQKRMVYGVDVYATPERAGSSGGGHGGAFVEDLRQDLDMLHRDVVSTSHSRFAERRFASSSARRSDSQSQTAATCTSIAMLQQLTSSAGGGGGRACWSEVSAGLTALSSLPVNDPLDPGHHPANAALEGVLRTAALEYHDVVRCSNVHVDSRRAGRLRMSATTETTSATRDEASAADDGAVRANVVSLPRLHAMSSHRLTQPGGDFLEPGGGDVDVDDDAVRDSNHDEGVTTIRDAIRDIITWRGMTAPRRSSRRMVREAAMAGVQHGPYFVSTTARASSRSSERRALRRDVESRPTVLVTGGLGAIGSEVALWLVERHAGSRVCLSGRTGRASSAVDDERGQSAMRRLCGGSADGGVVTVFRCDAAIQEECRQSAQDMRRPGGGKFLEGVTGVVHASGVLSDAMIPRQRAGGIRRVMAPKVAAASRLEAHVFGGGFNPVAANVMFSSVAALVGSVGQGGYSGANRAVDAAAINLRRGGHPASSLQWGAWGNGGMAAKDAVVLARIERQGIGVLSPEQGLAVLDAVFGSFAGIAGVSSAGGAFSDDIGQLGTARNLAVSPFDWGRIVQHVRPLPPVCREVCEEDGAPGPMHRGSRDERGAAAAASAFRGGGGRAAEDATTAGEWKEINAEESRAIPRLGDIREVITRATVDLTGNKEINSHEPLMNAGLDSLAGMGRGKLQEMALIHPHRRSSPAFV